MDGKRIKGRKRHLLVDTFRLILAVGVTAANTEDRLGLVALLTRYFADDVQRLRKLWVDGGYRAAWLTIWVRDLKRMHKDEGSVGTLVPRLIHCRQTVQLLPALFLPNRPLLEGGPMPDRRRVPCPHLLRQQPQQDPFRRKGDRLWTSKPRGVGLPDGRGWM